MSHLPGQSDVWTPDTIAKVIYRVFKILIEIANIWVKYRSLVRAMDEEHIIGGQLPTRHRRRPASSNKTTNINKLRFRSGSAVTSLVAAQLKTLIELASPLDNDQVDDNGPELSMDCPSSSGRNSTEFAHIGVGMDNMYLNCRMGVDLNLGDLGLRVRAGNCSKAPGESRHGH